MANPQTHNGTIQYFLEPILQIINARGLLDYNVEGATLKMYLVIRTPLRF